MQPGTKLAHYEITSLLGKGGMGEVYRARDTKLDREVALKALPAAFSDDPERVARFEREATTLAKLQHANIAAIYGFEKDQGRTFLIMELVAGEDLSERLQRGPIQPDEAINIATQIAVALEAAHALGIVHRDLKPANVKVTPTGDVKLLDFGLARAYAELTESDSSLELSDSPTITAPMTMQGTVLGTAAYMSPEQTRGETIDRQSDIWSFGVVLFEMLANQPPFAGKSLADTLAAVLKTEPNWSLLPAGTPPAVLRVLRPCLAKDTRERIHHIADARLELRAVEPAQDIAANPSNNNRAYLAVMALALAASLSFILWSAIQTRDSNSVSWAANPLAGARFSKISDFEGIEFDAAISPDGRFVTFISNRDGPFEIYVGQIGTTGFRKLETEENVFGPGDALAPVRSVGFNGDGSEIWLGGGPWRRVRTIPLLGGPMRNFLGETAVTVAWSPDRNRIVYHNRTAGDPLFIADNNGANIRELVSPPAGTHQHYPVWSTDGQWIYFCRGRPSTLEMSLWRVGVDGKGLEQLTEHLLDVRYPAPIDVNRVLYSARDSDGAGPWLWAFDVETRTSRRASVGLEQYTSLSASADGHRLVASVHDSRAKLWRVPILEGTATEANAAPYADLGTNRALSPRFGGASLFYLSSRGSGDGLWRYKDGQVTEIWRGSETALLEPVAVAPAGNVVALVLRKDDGWYLHTMRADGTELKLLTNAVDARGSAAWSPDGKWIVTGGYVQGIEGLYKIPVAGGIPELLVAGEALNPVWSPAGNLIVYTGAQVNVVSPLLAVRPDGSPVKFPSIEVFRWGERMRFLPDGSGLVFMQGNGPDQDFWLLDLATQNKRKLTELTGVNTMLTFDITPDGGHIVFDRLSEESDIVLIEVPGVKD